MDFIVVSDTSPIRALAHLGLLKDLKAIASTVIVPTEVERELLDPPGSLRPVAVASFDFFEVRQESASEELSGLLEELDAEEAEAIALSRELGISTILIDEAAGRAKAAEIGLNVVGTVGILIRLKQLGLIESVGPLLDDLRDRLGFFISESFRQRALDLAGES